MPRQETPIELLCPGCGARLKVDPALRRVIDHEPAGAPAKVPELGQASEWLEREASRREAHFRASAEDIKIRSQVLERKFREALKKTAAEPVTRPQREIDLD